MRAISRETSMNYGHPYRPGLIRAVNALGAGAARLGLRASLAEERLFRAALRAERCDGFTDIAFVEPLRVLLAAIESEARLHTVGRLITAQRLVHLLRNRLRVEKMLAAHPEVLEVPLPQVLLVTGLQRTGTTLLHRLLAQDPAHRALTSFEALSPTPLCADLDADRRRKRRMAITAERALSFLAPDFFAIHPVEADAPEEDVLLLDYAMLSTVAESTLRVPTYARFVETADTEPAYRYLRLLLQVLSFRQPVRRWVLKSPHHLEFLPTFLRVFPDARIVRTHRDPSETLPSFCSMMCHGRGVFSDHVDPLEVGRHWLRKTVRMARFGFEVLCGTPGAPVVPVVPVVDVPYTELVADPMEQMRRVYAMLDAPLSSETKTQMSRSLKVNVQHRYGVHRYDMASFGFTPDEIQSAYGEWTGPLLTGRIHDAS